jgi:hypothetical protein
VQHIWVCARGNEWWQVQIMGLKENEHKIDDLATEVISSIEITR